MKRPPLVIFDLETGGIAQTAPIIQIGAVAVQEGRECASYEAKLKFDEDLCEKEALELNSYDAELWARDAIEPTEAYAGFSKFLSAYATTPRVSKRTGSHYTVARLGGYNIVSFDIPRIRAAFEEHDMFFPAAGHVLDFFQLACWLFFLRNDWPESLTLDALCKQFSVEQGRHDALGDSRATADLGRKIVEALRRVLWQDRRQTKTAK